MDMLRAGGKPVTSGTRGKFMDPTASMVYDSKVRVSRDSSYVLINDRQTPLDPVLPFFKGSD